MTYTLIWRHAAVAGLIRLRVVDPLIAKTVRGAVAALADDPYPETSTRSAPRTNEDSAWEQHA